MIRFLKFVPKNHLSWFVGCLVHFNFPGPLARFSIRWFAERYKINVDEAEHPIENYKNIGDFFAEKEVDEIWITFPDPRPRGRDEHRRLTSSYFLQKYLDILNPAGCIHLKTDNSDLFDFSLNEVHKFGGKVIHATKDLYNSCLYNDELKIETTYEKKFLNLGFKMNYLKFGLKAP